MSENNENGYQYQQSDSFLQSKHKLTESNDEESNNDAEYLSKKIISSENPNIDNPNDNQSQSVKKQNINCQICKVKESIYKCPRCQIKTCCLACVKEHKRIYKCTGVRDKFSKKPVKDFTDNDYVRDLNFINGTINETNRIGRKVFDLTEENPTDVVYIYNSSKVNSGIPADSDKNHNEKSDNANKDKDKERKNEDMNGNENKEINNDESKKQETKSFVKDAKRSKNFKKLCKKFRNVNLECAPKLIKKFAENKSYCDSKQRKFFWTIKFNFLCDIQGNSRVYLSEPLKSNFKTFKPQKIFVLENLQTYSHLFEDPIDDSIHSLNSLFNFLLVNKNFLNFDLLLKFKEEFENLDQLVFLMRMNMEGNLPSYSDEEEEGAIAVDFRKSKNSENSQKPKNEKVEKEVYRIKDAFYAAMDKNVLIKDLLDGKYVHEYPEFEIINKKILENV